MFSQSRLQMEQQEANLDNSGGSQYQQSQASGVSIRKLSLTEKNIILLLVIFLLMVGYNIYKTNLLRQKQQELLTSLSNHYTLEDQQEREREEKALKIEVETSNIYQKGKRIIDQQKDNLIDKKYQQNGEDGLKQKQQIKDQNVLTEQSQLVKMVVQSIANHQKEGLGGDIEGGQGNIHSQQIQNASDKEDNTQAAETDAEDEIQDDVEDHTQDDTDDDAEDNANDEVKDVFEDEIEDQAENNVENDIEDEGQDNTQNEVDDQIDVETQNEGDSQQEDNFQDDVISQEVIQDQDVYQDEDDNQDGSEYNVENEDEIENAESKDEDYENTEVEDESQENGETKDEIEDADIKDEDQEYIDSDNVIQNNENEEKAKIDSTQDEVEIDNSDDKQNSEINAEIQQSKNEIQLNNTDNKDGSQENVENEGKPDKNVESEDEVQNLDVKVDINNDQIKVQINDSKKKSDKVNNQTQGGIETIQVENKAQINNQTQKNVVIDVKIQNNETVKVQENAKTNVTIDNPENKSEILNTHNQSEIGKAETKEQIVNNGTKVEIGNAKTQKKVENKDFIPNNTVIEGGINNLTDAGQKQNNSTYAGQIQNNSTAAGQLQNNFTNSSQKQNNFENPVDIEKNETNSKILNGESKNETINNDTDGEIVITQSQNNKTKKQIQNANETQGLKNSQTPSEVKNSSTIGEIKKSSITEIKNLEIGEETKQSSETEDVEQKKPETQVSLEDDVAIESEVVNQTSLQDEPANNTQPNDKVLSELNPIVTVSPKAKAQISLPKPKIPKFPKILWILSSRNASALTTYQNILKNAMKNIGELSGYEVRVVDVWSAYDYLSKSYRKKITKSMHSKKVNIKVEELLRLALLIQKGGVFLQLTDYTLLEDLKWLDEIFEGKEGELYEKYRCPGLKYPQVFIFQQKAYNIFPKGFKRQLLAARKNSTLLRQIFQQMLAMIQTGKWKYQNILKINYIDQKTNATSFRNFLENILISKLVTTQKKSNKDFCHHYKIQSLNIGDDFNFQDYDCSYKNPQLYIKDLQEQQIEKCFTARFFINPARGIKSKIIDIMKQQTLQSVHPNSFIAKTIFSGDNQQFLVKKPENKSIHMCVVSLKVVPKDDQQKLIERSLDKLKKQTFQNWTAVYLVEEGQAVSSVISQTKKYWVVPSRGNQGLDAQRVYVNHCPSDSIIFLLAFDEKLGKKALTLVADKLKIPGIFGAFIPISYGKTRKIPEYSKDFNRINNYLKSDVNDGALNNVLNHFRVFQSRMYRLIPKYDLHRLGGSYYQDRLLYLITMLEMANSFKLEDHSYYDYQISQRSYPLPKDYVVITDVTISTTGLENYNRDQLKELKYKIEGYNIIQSLNYFNQYGVPFQKFFVFNDGLEPQTYEKRRVKPHLIPRIIHQIWIRGQLPPIKLYLSKKTKKMYPNYKYKIWREKDITKKNFPYTYLILKRLLQFQKVSKYNKFVMMADIMRGEILYQQGGFYLDFNLQLFRKTFDDWLTYKLVMPAEQIFKSRATGQICFMAAMPKFQPLLRVLNYRNTNQYDIYSEKSSLITGSYNYHKIIWGNQQQDADYLLIPYQLMFPASDVRVHNDWCVVFGKDVKDAVMEGEKGLLKNCEELYPLQIASEHYEFGKSQLIRKNN